MSAYRPYPKTKPSGVEWLGDVPEEWEVQPLKFAANLLTRKSVGRRNAIGLENIESWSGRFIDTETEFEGEGVAVEAGDILFGKLRPYLAKALLVTEPSDAVGDFHAMRPQRGTHAQFILYQILSKEFIVMVDGSTFGSKMPRANWEFVGKMPLPLPPLPEQHQIAAFLDRECGKLDALQAKQERLIELLKEKRQALISHAVTRGLDPTAKLKPSGIEWLGEVPEGWRVARLRFVIRELESGVSVNSIDTPADSDQFGVLKTSCVYTREFRPDENKAVVIEEMDRVRCPVKKNCLIISRMNTPELVGAAGFVDRDYPTLFLPDRLWQTIFYQPSEEAARFLSFVMSLKGFRDEIGMISTGTSSSMKNIAKEDLLGLTITLPPLAEQRAIVAHLDEKCGKIDQLKAKAERGIELLKERRNALISAAVTGKIEVRDQ